MQPSQIDQQLGPAVAYLAALLRGGYSLLQAADRLAEDGPAPLAAVFRRLADDVRLGVDSAEALADIQRRFPSPYLDRVIGAIARQRRRGGNLAAILEPLGAAIRQRAGSQGATPAQRVRLEQIEGIAIDWPAFEPSPAGTAAPPVEALLNDPEISELLIDGPYRIDVVRQGRLESVDGLFLDDEELLEWVRGVVGPLGHQIDAAHPLLNLRLPDDSTINIVAQPVSPDGTAVVVRKAPSHDLGVADLLRFGAFSEEMLAFLRACVAGRVNMVVSGGISSGKTTLLNLLCAQIAAEERVITVEATRELRLRRRRLLALEGGQPNQGAGGNLSVAELLQQALLMLPERLVVGELRGAEVLALARAINVGHNGSMGSIHAASPRDALLNLEQMASTAEPAIPLRAVRHELAAAFQLIVQINRMADGVRRVTAIAEVAGMEGDTIALREIFRFEAAEHDAAGRIGGSFVATGHSPAWLGQLDGYLLPQPASLPVPGGSALEAQVAETSALAAGLLRVGYSIVQTLAILAQELPDPLRGLLDAASREIGAGRPIGEALEAMARQAGSPALQLLVGAIVRQRSEGGNLADGLEGLVERLPKVAGDDHALNAASERIRMQYGLPPRTPSPAQDSVG